ncbi:MAG: hypothetical protein ABSD08_14650 [Xanthobacteraceae bacterium]|jgi:hypothetical protein
MAIEDNLDQLYALYVANNILCMRMWGYVASIGAKAEGFSEQAWIEKHRKMSLESADLWKLEGHRNPNRLRQMIKEQLNQSWSAIIKGPPSGTPIQ